MHKVQLTRLNTDQPNSVELLTDEFEKLGNQVTSVLNNLVLPEISSFKAPMYPATISLSSTDINSLMREEQEAEMRRLEIQLLKQKILEQQVKLNTKQIPQYDPNIDTLFFMGKKIQIPPNTNQERICRIIFKNTNNMKRLWSRDELVEKWGENPDMIGWRVVYNAAREINKKVAIETNIKDLLTIKKVSVRLNPKYLQV